MRSNPWLAIFTLLLLFSPVLSDSQEFFRIKADFSIKTKSDAGKQQLVIGTVYYDKTKRKIIHRIDFPEDILWFQKDTMLYEIIDGNVSSTQKIPSVIELSIYHLALNNNLTHFGLEQSGFLISHVEKDEGLVISTWLPPDNYKAIFGKILLAKKDNKLHGVIFHNADGIVISKQVISKYIFNNGLYFPGEIIKISNLNGIKTTEITTYKKILVNDFKEDHFYNYSIDN